jgi:Leucine-rich repeat (LRR) protein
LVQGASPKLKNLQLSSSKLRDLHINRFYGWQSGVSFLETAMIDAPWLQRLAIEKAPALRQLSLNSHVLSSLSVIGANVLGGFDENWCPAKLGSCAFRYEEQISIGLPEFWQWPLPPPSKLPSALTSLDVCCPSLRSFFLTQCSGLQSLDIEQRSPPPSLAAADDKVFEAAMAAVLGQIEVSSCDGLSQLVLKATPASSAVVASPKASSPQKKLKTATETATARPPRRSAVVEWNVEECGRLRTVEVDDGWMLGPKAKRSLTYFASQHPDVKVCAKGIGNDKATKN